MAQIILIDNVKYYYWEYRNEDQLEKIVREHASDLFGKDCLYFDIKQKIKSKAGIGSIPDGYLVKLSDEPEWYIVEIELSSHPVYDHIVTQVNKFNTGIKNPNSLRQILNVLHEEVEDTVEIEKFITDRIGRKEIYKYLDKLLSTPPKLCIVIDEKNDDLVKEIQLSVPFETYVIELKTFVREGVGPEVHAHIFQPLFKEEKQIKTYYQSEKQITTSTNQIVIELNPSSKEYHLIHVPRSHRSFFPGYKVDFELETDNELVVTRVTAAKKGTPYGDPIGGTYFTGLADWYRAHPELKTGDKVVITALEPGKRYRLDIA